MNWTLIEEQMHNCKQIHLGDMEYGLARMIAVIGLSPAQISEMSGVVFETACEAGFGYFLGALLIDNKGRQFCLRQYYLCQKKFPDQTELIGSERSMDTVADLGEFLDELGIHEEYVLWRYEK
jgi:hypothetical protein